MTSALINLLAFRYETDADAESDEFFAEDEAYSRIQWFVSLVSGGSGFSSPEDRVELIRAWPAVWVVVVVGLPFPDVSV